MALSDLTVDVFHILQEAFFNPDGSSKPFPLPDKKNTQDDPFDVYVAALLARRLTDATCQKSSGKLINPDMAVYRRDECNKALRKSLMDDLSRIVGIEVKKLERNKKSGQISRAGGLDYNSKPPCGHIRIYDDKDVPIDIRGFYLFVCQEPTSDNKNYIITALALCDGDILNADFKLYLEITGKRTKGVGLGTYGDGLNRNRPMLVFANPLGAVQFDKRATLITKAKLTEEEAGLGIAYQVGRTIPEGGQGIFYAYWSKDTIPEEWEPLHLVDPFPKPVSKIETSQRGKFVIPIRPLGETQIP